MKLVWVLKKINSMDSSVFYSKILLFGEYGILKNSNGLSVPYDQYSGRLNIGDLNIQKVVDSNSNLLEFYNYLSKKSEIKSLIKLDRLFYDLKSGLFFESSIPTGYGVGSSGAIVAAIYEHYIREEYEVLNKTKKNRISDLIKNFSLMESFFHGKSSGLDPLNSFMKLPILINFNHGIQTTSLPIENTTGDGGIFIIDSGLNRNTESLVNLFFELMADKDVSNAFDKEFIRYTNKCVENFLNSEFNELYMNTKKISKFILENFEFMIPKGFKNLWEKGINTEDFILKPCGSGGGGFILGLSMDLNKAKSYFSKFSFKVVFSF